ncbi:acyltransferase [Paraburkholderia sp. Tr-20389]|uniref:acyltransferase family protein n=1 Tax=Paraburkholderia sp. Tr-20389 TaxID=2703903 RepID=UPI00197D822D|nr:acyltransferase [Paraburkholderia sp. Tr-20389]MBN3756587.1 acyltransferase [Paraburkholderia sp. Tr-20389]
MKEKFSVLDLLRFSLALYLTLFHSIHQYPQSRDVPLIELAGMGGFVTSTFFILSGFILAHVYFRDSESMRGSTRTFFVKRLSNLYVIHFIGLVLFFAVALVSTHAFTSFPLMTLDDGPEQMVALAPATATLNVVLNVLLLQVWNPLYGSINPSSWSLAVLLFFYLTFPFAAPRLLAVRNKRALLCLLWGLYLGPPVLASVLHWYEPVAVGTILRNPVLRLPEFFGGIVLYGMYRESMLVAIASTSGRRIIALGFVACCFVAGAWAIAHGPEYSRYLVHNGAMLPSELVLVALCTSVKVPANCERFASRLGNSALSIFAIHAPIFMLMIKATKLLSMGISPLECAKHFAACAAASRDVVPGMGSLPLYLIATAVAAVYFQEYLVAPLRDCVRRKLLSDRHAKAEPGAASA